MNPAVVAPDGFDIVDISAGATLHPEQRRSLGSVAKVLQHAAARKVFEGENSHLCGVNRYLEDTHAKFRWVLGTAPGCEEWQWCPWCSALPSPVPQEVHRRRLPRPRARGEVQRGRVLGAGGGGQAGHLHHRRGAHRHAQGEGLRPPASESVWCKTASGGPRGAKLMQAPGSLVISVVSLLSPTAKSGHWCPRSHPCNFVIPSRDHILWILCCLSSPEPPNFAHKRGLPKDFHIRIIPWGLLIAALLLHAPL